MREPGSRRRCLARFDARLRRGGDAYVEDDGFTDRVMAKLPGEVAHSPHRWIVPAMGVLGFLVGIVCCRAARTCR
jgi:hypothetical protein